MAIKVILDLNIKQDLTQKYMEFLDKNLPNVRGFEGCEDLKVYFNSDSKDMIISETWSSKQAHSKYIEFISNNGIMEQLKSFFNKEASIKYYDILDI